MKEQFCSYEIALALKELGFNEGCFASFYKDDKVKEIVSEKWYDNNNHRLPDYKIAAPLWQQVIDFFREKYKMEVAATPVYLNEAIGVTKVDSYLPFVDGDYLEDECETFYEAREKAVLKAIELCKKN